jgi:hypothetical protein
VWDLTQVCEMGWDEIGRGFEKWWDCWLFFSRKMNFQLIIRMYVQYVHIYVLGVCMYVHRNGTCTCRRVYYVRACRSGKVRAMRDLAFFLEE